MFFSSLFEREIAVKHRFVAYYRVSTRKQGQSGLGLDAQRTAVANYLGDGLTNVVAEFTEVESGRRNDRPALDEALTVTRLHRAALVVAKVDRLTRSVGFLGRLLDAGVDVRFADLPAIEGSTGRFMLQQMAAVAELEAGLISARTKAALAAAKARGQRLGGSRGGKLSDEAKALGRHEQSLLADRRAKDLSPILAKLRAKGVSSPTEIALALTGQGIPTARGGSVWSAPQVTLVTARLARILSDRIGRLNIDSDGDHTFNCLDKTNSHADSQDRKATSVHRVARQSLPSETAHPGGASYIFPNRQVE